MNPTFRTASTEPKLAAFQYVVNTGRNSSRTDPIWIVTTEWWNDWPLRYLALAEPGVRVESWPSVGDRQDFQQALREGRAWCIEFTGSPAHDHARKMFLQVGVEFKERTIDDPLGRPIRSREYGDDFTVKVPDEIDTQRARRVLEELRRRFGEPLRPQIELDYIERLLRGF